MKSLSYLLPFCTSKSIYDIISYLLPDIFLVITGEGLIGFYVNNGLLWKLVPSVTLLPSFIILHKFFLFLLMKMNVPVVILLTFLFKMDQTRGYIIKENKYRKETGLLPNYINALLYDLF